MRVEKAVCGSAKIDGIESSVTLFETGLRVFDTLRTKSETAHFEPEIVQFRVSRIEFDIIGFRRELPSGHLSRALDCNLSL